MTAAETSDLLSRYAQVARPIILEHFRLDSCIASTAITKGVLEHFGLKAVPYPCRATVYNAAFTKKLRDTRRFPKNQQECLEWEGEGAWSVGIGFPSPDMKTTEWVSDHPKT